MRRRVVWRYGGLAAALLMVAAATGPAFSQEQADSQPAAAEHVKFYAAALPGTGLAKANNHLLEAAQLAGDGVEGEALAAAVPVLRYQKGKVEVEVVFHELDDAAEAAVRAAGLEVTGVFPDYLIVTGLVDLANLEAIGAVADVELIRPNYGATTNAGSTTSQADASIEAGLLRLHEGLDGTGIEVGVLSDSFNKLSAGTTTGSGGCATTTSGTASQVSGDLPDPVGNIGPVPPGGGYIDEGRGMMELIHDLAPGADLTFRTAFVSEPDFAAGISALVTCGADVVVDDIIYFAEPMFQDGLVAQAADAAFAAGVPFFSSAGNQATFGVHEAYADSAATDDTIFPPTGDDFHDWDPGAGVDTFVPITVPSGAGLRLVLQWNQPFTGSLGPGSANDLDLWACPTEDPACPGGSSSTGLQGGPSPCLGPPSGDPLEILEIAAAPGSRTFHIAVEHYCGTEDVEFRIVPYGVGASITDYTFGTASGGAVVFDKPQIYGHAAAADAMAVGAVYYGEIDANGTLEGGPEINTEDFSSLGGELPFYFDGSGTPLAGAPVTRFKPEMAAPDGTNTSFFGSSDPPCCEGDGFPNFFGTSAAAPHAAAVAALMLEGRPGMTPGQVYERMRATAIDIEVGGRDTLAGDGLVDTFAAAALAIDHVILDDVNSNGSFEAAILQRDLATGKFKLQVREIDTGAVVKTTFLGSTFEAMDVEAVLDGAVPDLAVLQYNRSTGVVQATVLDALSGAVTNTVKWGAAYEPFDMEVVPAGASDHLALLGRASNGAIWGLVRNAASGAIVKNVKFGTDLDPVDLEVLAGGGPDLALLGTAADQSVRVDVRDYASGALVKKVAFGSLYEPTDLEPVDDAGADDVAMLGHARSNGAAWAVVRDSASGALVKNVKFGPGYRPIDLESVIDAGADNLAMLARRPAGDSLWVIEKDSVSGLLVASAKFGSAFRPVGLEISYDSTLGYAVLESRYADGKRFLHVRDATSAVLGAFAV